MSRIPEVLQEKIVAYYENHKSVFKVAKRFGVGSSTVHRILKAKGVNCDGLSLYRQRIRKIPDAEALKAEYESGVSMNALSEKYAVAQSTIRDGLNRAGAVARRRGGQKKILTDEDRQRIVSLYDDLGSQTAVAAIVGRHQLVVSRVLRKAGITDGRRPQGAKHGSWKGGRIKAGPYFQVLVGIDDPIAEMRNALGYVLEHRAVMARALGRVLTPHETVHHINGDTADNRIENLQLRFGKHGKGVTMICKNCGSHDITYQVLK